ncbi:PREDICTED: phosphonates import ATP-binding protein PhnC-like, partial [Cyphomyrmex costatus]|uniref:phosphonates import ATP-binding protein PhnC-like n=1 Tax=Cyphomyrmex costatus TaxID=456900 RepID=UPI00085234DF
RVESLSKSFGQVEALDNVTIDFSLAKFNVLLGLSGSGKSTLLRHMNGLYTPTSGKAVTLGVDVSNASGDALRS